MTLNDLESCLGTLNAPCDRIASLDLTCAPYEQGQNVIEVANLFQPYQIARNLGTEIEMLKSLCTQAEHGFYSLRRHNVLPETEIEYIWDARCESIESRYAKHRSTKSCLRARYIQGFEIYILTFLHRNLIFVDDPVSMSSRSLKRLAHAT